MPYFQDTLHGVITTSENTKNIDSVDIIMIFICTLRTMFVIKPLFSTCRLLVVFNLKPGACKSSVESSIHFY